MLTKFSSTSNRSIRIIGGKWKRRRLPIINNPNLRPTTNFARETLFNWLNFFIFNTHCLDCFAGSGALGFEALSRHAASATFIEKEYNIAEQIRRSINTLKASNVKVINIDLFIYLSQIGTPYDIVFVDPPFHKNMLKKTINLLEKNNWLASNALIYVESEAESDTPRVPICWYLHRKKAVGQVLYCLYRRKKLTNNSTSII